MSSSPVRNVRVIRQLQTGGPAARGLARAALGLAALPVAAALLAACGGERRPPAATPWTALPPDPEIALDARALTPPPEIAPPVEPSPAPRPRGSVTFAREIAPIVHAHCAVCHHPDGAGPFSLLAYDEVKKRAGQIATVTRSRYMPPWQPDHGTNAWQGERRLSAEEIGLLAQWAEEGAPPGDLARAPAPPSFPAGWTLGEPDAIVSFPAPYLLRGDGGDVFRNFVIPDALPASHWVRGLEFRSGGTRAIHHAEIRLDETPGSRALDDADPVPGFEGMETETAHYPEGHFLNWVPGKLPAFEPAGRAWRLGAGDDLVVQLHLLPTGKEERVAPQIGLHFAEEPPTDVTPLNLRLASRSMDIPAGEARYVIEDTYTLPVDVEVLSVMPHAHYLGKDMQAWATLPDGTKQWLVRIRDWDFNWQDEYRYAVPLALPRGTVLAMRYTYDNSAANERNPHKPPVRVTYGPRSFDEMGDLWVRVRPRGEMERQLLGAHQARHRALEDAADAERALAAAGATPDGHKRAAKLYERAGRGERAIVHLEAALAADPDDPEAHELLGLALRQKGDGARALEHVERAAALRPDAATTQYNLAGLYAAAGRPADARRALERAVALDPGYVRARTQLGVVLAQQGQYAEAVAQLRDASRLSGGRDPAVEQALAAAERAATGAGAGPAAGGSPRR